MNTIPPELHSYICQLACTDDGSTFRALSVLSKYFHALVLPLQYQSVAISGFDSVLKLASRLEVAQPHMRRIHHLFISDRPHPNLAVIQEPRQQTYDLEKKATLRILTLSAPILESLTFIASNPTTSTSMIARLFDITFPRLQDLSITGYYPFPHRPNTMPQLKRLHLHGNRNPHGLLELGSLHAACPSLTHLRISGLKLAVSFIEELTAALEFHSQRESVLPSSIECIVLERAVVSKLSIKATCIAEERTLNELTRLVHVASRVKRVELIIRDIDGLLDLPKEKDRWAEQMVGASLCWT